MMIYCTFQIENLGCYNKACWKTYRKRMNIFLDRKNVTLINGYRTERKKMSKGVCMERGLCWDGGDAET